MHTTMFELLARQAAEEPTRSALVFLQDGETATQTATYAELHARARRLAQGLLQQGWAGRRVLLMFPSSIEYVEAFLGCLYAGVVAVPLYPPRNNWHAQRAAAIVRDAGACAVLTSAALQGDVVERMHSLMADVAIAALETIFEQAVGEAAAVEAAPIHVRPDDLAYLQYTSGSTGTPKGVMVSHRNLLTNARLYNAGAGVPDASVFVSWLPIFHDMGLVQGIVMPLVCGGTAVFMPPASFVQKPVRWLRALSVWRGVMSGGPNFAYELCATKVTREEAQGLDLSSWRIAVNAAEPISAATLDKFRRAYAGAGFDPAAFCGGYGLAEATLYVACGEPGQAPVTLHVERAALERDRVVALAAATAPRATLVSSGAVKLEPAVRIVDHGTGAECGAGQVGEIWVGGASICAGYWNRPAESHETFHARLGGEPGRRFLRTGDLGFIQDGQLFVTGRIKDLIIVRGANHYPQDIEATVEGVHPALRRGGWGAAFAIEVEGEERVVVVQEVEREARRRLDAQAVGAAIARQVGAGHGIDVHAVAFVAPGGVPKTSSGKIQRRTCRGLFLEGKLEELGRWERSAAAAQTLDAGPAWAGRRQAEAALVRLAAEILEVPQASIARDAPFAELGFDSVRIVEFVSRVGALAGRALAASSAFDHPNIGALAAHLLGERDDGSDRQTLAEPIAIVGMACRFPGADGVDAFWDLLEEGDGAIRAVDPERAALTGFAAAPGAPYRMGGLIDDVAGFDPGVFGIAPREAASIDPQQRLLLQTAWHALEAAQIAPDSLQGSATGVFVGICASDYFRLQKEAGSLDAYAGTGSALSVAANRLSYCFGLQGPSMAIDTACSSSLVAVHQACRSLAEGESTLALAGGVNLILSDDYGRIFSQAGMLSPSGQCRSFDDGADGYVRGEGCGVVVLRRLADARHDGDRILAVIRGSAVNQDGFSNGLTAPNGVAQQNVIRAAQRRARVAPDSIGYVETHGTGTPLGDPIEVHALSQVLDGVATDAPCWLGAVKTHIGHLEAAAGIAGLIKTVLVLQHGRIPANRNLEKLNAHLRLDGSRLAFPTAGVAWAPPPGVPRRAGVSSFGFGGTNAHLVLEESPLPSPATDKASGLPCLLPLAAHVDASLREMAAAYAQAVERAGDAHLRSLCRGAARVRAGLRERAVVGAANAAEMVRSLRQLAADGRAAAGAVVRGSAGHAPRIAFLFTGQGSQYLGMGRELYAAEPVYRRHLDGCDAILRPRLGRSIVDLMLCDDGASVLDDTRYAQPAILALQLALCALLKDWGVQPELVLGHSVGEYAAACAAGIMSEGAALEIVCERARLMAAAPGQGAMLSVQADWERAQGLVEGLALDLAAVNGPGQCVLSGDPAAIAQAARRFEAQEIGTAQLQVSHAFHSRLMAPVLAPFAAVLAAREFSEAGRAGFVSSGDAGDPTQAAYWVAQIRQPVRFYDALLRAIDAGADTFVEIGAQPTLTGLGRRAGLPGEWIATLKNGEDAAAASRQALARLYVRGADCALPRVDRHLAGAAWPLPAYPFQRTPYWFDRTQRAPAAAPAAGCLLGERLPLALDHLAVFQTCLPNRASAYLADHCVFGAPVMPAAGYLSLAQAAMAAVHPGGRIALRDASFVLPMPLGAALTVQTLVEKTVDAWRVSVLSRGADTGWQTHMRLDAVVSDEAAAPASMPAAAGIAMADAAAFYAEWGRHGLEYGPAFQPIRLHGDQDGVIQAELRLPPGVGKLSEGALHPVLLDGAFQTVGRLLQGHSMMATCLPLPVKLGRLVCSGELAQMDALLVRARLLPQADQGMVAADIELCDPSGRLLARIEHLGLRWLARAELGVERAAPIYREEWEPGAAPSSPGGAWWMAALGGGDAAPAFDRLRVERAVVDGATLGTALKERLRTADGLQGVVLHFAPSPAAEEEPLAPAQAACTALQAALLAFAEADAAPGGRACVVLTHGALAPNREPRAIAATALAGLVKSAAREYPHLALRHIDLPLDPSPRDWQLLESCIGDGREACLAIRGAAVQVPRLQAWHAPAAPSRQIGPRADGCYLITGGLGALGLHLTEHLAASGARHLVLVTRRAVAEGAAARRLAQLAARGVRIDLRAADLASRAQVRELIAAIASGGARLRGIVHASGSKDDRALASIAPAGWHGPMAAKAGGAHWLDLETRSAALDFFVGFSSVAGVLGSAGQASYAAANALMSGVLARRHALLGDAAVLHWGPWAGEGMADDARLHAHLAQQGIGLLDPGPACRALDAVLAAGLPQALVAEIDWNQLAARRAADRHQIGALVAQDAGRDAGPEVACLLPDAQTLAELDSTGAMGRIGTGLAALLTEVLKTAPQEFDDKERLAALRLSSLGIDSLMAMELRNRVRAWVQVELPAHVLIGGGSFREVVELIYQKIVVRKLSDTAPDAAGAPDLEEDAELFIL